MSVESVHIESLLLRVPGLSPEEARRLGEDVARLLAEKLPPSARPQRIGALDLRIRAEPGAPGRDVAGQIVAALLESLR